MIEELLYEFDKEFRRLIMCLKEIRDKTGETRIDVLLKLKEQIGCNNGDES
mgnify:CR=1 FL=1